ncbi:P2X purinoceptor 7-like [Haemaphysalis longicornis]
MDPALRSRLEKRTKELGWDPYESTPRRKVSRKDADPESPASPGRSGDEMNWCQCGLCVASPKPLENVCCRGIAKVVAKSNNDCITRHAYFPTLCLNPAVLEAVYWELESHGVPMPCELHRKYRFTAYRLFTRWCWGRLGTANRVVLPACVVGHIRQHFPSASYVGFQYPVL